LDQKLEQVLPKVAAADAAGAGTADAVETETVKTRALTGNAEWNVRICA
jgi:hypothetical protein